MWDRGRPSLPGRVQGSGAAFAPAEEDVEDGLRINI